MNLPPELPISAEDWKNTPATVQAVVILLWQENQTLKEQVAQLESQVAGLQAEVTKLRERVNKNSRNSSKPPSSDPPQTPRYPKPKPSREKKGGQKGHHGHEPKLKGPGEVSRIAISLPTVCKECGTLLLGVDPQPERHQGQRTAENRVGNCGIPTPHAGMQRVRRVQPGRMAQGNAHRQYQRTLAGIDRLLGWGDWDEQAGYGRNAGNGLSGGCQLGKYPRPRTAGQPGAGKTGGGCAEICANPKRRQSG